MVSRELISGDAISLATGQLLVFSHDFYCAVQNDVSSSYMKTILVELGATSATHLTLIASHEAQSPIQLHWGLGLS